MATAPAASRPDDPTAALASRFVDPAGMDWTPTRFAGIDAKVLMRDDERGLMTALFRWAPGASLPDHVHADIEQTYVLEGSLEDDEGIAGPGEFVWRPAGSRHVARAPNGAVILAVFLRPNRFIGDEAGGGTV
jgi:anti-sigma factor ChrR (cupin superfamily)